MIVEARATELIPQQTSVCFSQMEVNHDANLIVLSSGSNVFVYAKQALLPQQQEQSNVVGTEESASNNKLLCTIEAPGQIDAMALSDRTIVVSVYKEEPSKSSLYSFPIPDSALNIGDNKQEQHVDRFAELLTVVSGQVTRLEFNGPYGRLLAVCFEKQNHILLIHLDQPDKISKLQCTDMAEKTGCGFVGCSFDPMKQYFAAISTDLNHFVVWYDVTTEHPRQLHCENFKGGNRMAEQFLKQWTSDEKARNVRPPISYTWYPQGRTIAVPLYNNHQVSILTRNEWTKQCHITQEIIDSPYIAKFSPNGVYLMTVSAKSGLLVFALDTSTQNIKDQAQIVSYTTDSIIVDAHWSSNTNQIYMTTLNGKCQLLDIPVCVGSAYKISNNESLLEKVMSFNDESDTEEASPSVTSASDLMEVVMSDDESVDEGEDREETTVPALPKKTTRRLVKNKNLSQSQKEGSQQQQRKQKETIDLNDVEPMSPPVNNTPLKLKKASQEQVITIFPSPMASPISISTVEKPQTDSDYATSAKVTALQPGSTEFMPRGGAKFSRLMSYSSLGKIRATYGAGQMDSYSIEISLSDVTMGGHQSYDDLYKPHVAALSEHGAVFASSKRSKQGLRELIVLPATVYYKPNGRGQKQWRYMMGLDEHVRCVAAGYSGDSGFVAAATVFGTNQHRVHIFDCVSGLPTFVQLLPGVAFCLVAHRNFLLVVYADEDQKLWFQLYDVKNSRMLKHERLPFGHPVTIDWVGFSIAGFPAIQSAQSVAVFISHLDAWVPALSEPLPKLSDVVYISDQKIFYVKKDSENSFTEAIENSKDITFPFASEQLETVGLDEKKKPLNAFFVQYYSERQREIFGQDVDFKKADRTLFMFLYDLVDDKKRFNADILRFLVPYIRNESTIEALRKACTTRSINLDALLPIKRSAPQASSSTEHKQLVDVTRIQQLESQVLSLKQQLLKMEQALQAIETRIVQPVVHEKPLPISIVTSIEHLESSTTAEPEKTVEDAGFFSPKRPRKSHVAEVQKKRKREDSNSQQPKKKGSLLQFLSSTGQSQQQ